MLPSHPFERLGRGRLTWTAAASSLLSLAVGGYLLRQGAVLRNPVSPHGLVDFELCRDPACLSALFLGWGPSGLEEVRRLTTVDYAFLASYGPALASLSLLLPGGGRFPGVARAAAWAAFAAAGLDVLENSLGLAILAGAPHRQTAPLMAACAAFKFLLVSFPLAWMPLALFIRAPRE